jgi:peptidoglycan L-alanyl-D-glutamate endopeptidase CwlK
MAKWSTRSAAKLSTCHEDIKKIANKVLEIHDCSVFEGHRDEVTQNAYFASGNSKVLWPDSKHNKYPSMAIDLAPYIPGKDPYNMHSVLYFAGIFMGVAEMLYRQGEITHKVRWGGDWDMDDDMDDESFFDGIHFELI